MWQKRPFALPIRFRLTLWYVAALGLILLLFAGLLYIQLQRTMFNQIDTALELAATQGQGLLVVTDGRLAQTFDAMLARLEEAFKREQRFTGDAAHELRTPLTALKGQLEVTLSRSRSEADYRATLQAMQQQVDRLIHLSNSLLYMARLEKYQIEQPM